MIIDFHAHVFPDAIAERAIFTLEQRAGIKANTDGTWKGLSISMAQAGVDLSVILPVITRVSQFESVNNFAKTINETYAGKLLSFGGIHPDCEDYKKELDYIKKLGLPGIKIHPDYQGVMIDDVRYMKIIEYANELGLIIITHAGLDAGLLEPIHCPPDKMRKVIDLLKPTKMVVAHYGGWKQWEMVYEYLAGESVYLDTALTFDFLEPEWFMKIYQKHDKGKILFATDSPWSNAVKGIAAVQSLPICQAEKEAILFNNAKKLLNLVSYTDVLKG